MIALSNRLPRSTRKPASAFIGLVNGRITLSSWMVVERQFSPMVLPLTVGAFSRIRPCFISSLTTAGTPPAW
jgi:hypothetical protein